MFFYISKIVHSARRQKSRRCVNIVAAASTLKIVEEKEMSQKKILEPWLAAKIVSHLVGLNMRSYIFKKRVQY